MRIDKETEMNVARYDTAHGTPHRDVMGRRVGLIGKTWYLESDYRKVLNQAINDFKLNYEDYLRIYERY
jgi:hypothetical protein